MARTESLSTSPDPRCDIIPIEAVGQRRAYRGIAQPFAAHAHDHYVIGLVEDGRRRLVCNDREYLLAPGDLFVFNPGDIHGCTQASEAWFAFDSITIAKEIFNSTALQGPVIKDMLTVRAFKNACTALDSGDGSAFADALARLLECLHACERDRRRTTLHAEAAQHAFRRFCADPTQTPSLKELAHAEGLSPYALIRAYRQRFAITPLQYLISLRVERACQLLAEDIEPACVAAKAGFADQAHLTRAFKQRMGTTPAAYRKMIRSTKRCR